VQGWLGATARALSNECRENPGQVPAVHHPSGKPRGFLPASIFFVQLAQKWPSFPWVKRCETLHTLRTFHSFADQEGSCVESAIGALISRERATFLLFFGEEDLSTCFFLKKAHLSPGARSALPSSSIPLRG
jgi:hypothetical protein